MKPLSTLLMTSLLGATALTTPALADDDSAISVFLESVDGDRDDGRPARGVSFGSDDDRDDWGRDDDDDDEHDDDDNGSDDDGSDDDGDDDSDDDDDDGDDD